MMCVISIQVSIEVAQMIPTVVVFVVFDQN